MKRMMKSEKIIYVSGETVLIFLSFMVMASYHRSENTPWGKYVNVTTKDAQKFCFSLREDMQRCSECRERLLSS